LSEGFPYICCMGEEVTADPDALKTMFDFMAATPSVGLVGGKIFHSHMPHYIQHFGMYVDFRHFKASMLYADTPDSENIPNLVYCDAISGSCMMVRAKAIEKAGLMPTENFLYWDDTEWCYRCNLAGYKVASVGNAKALHAMGAKNEAVNTFPTYYAWRNWIMFFAKYTPEEKLGQMAEAFLGMIFQNVYEGLHSGCKNRTKTIMLAYDDAIHGKMGRAGENRIFDLDFHLEPFHRLFKGKDKIYLESNGYEQMADWIRNLAGKLGYDITWLERQEDGVPIISFCESVFKLEDLSRQKIYIDLSDCIFETEEDALDVINYNYSKRSFIFAQKPVFLECVMNLRNRK